jgi:hypothetical protein
MKINRLFWIRKIFIFYRTNFTEISIKSEEFLELQLEQFIDILNSDVLNVKSEEAVFDAIIRWIDYKVDERKKVWDKFLTRFLCMSNIVFNE